MIQLFTEKYYFPFRREMEVLKLPEFLFKRASLIVLLTLLNSLQLIAQNSTPYTYQNVAIGGGGLVPGIIYSEAEEGLIYARTDVGGSYRWDSENKNWIPLTEMVSDFNDWGVLSLAADPSDANRVYMATGLYEADWWGNQGRLFASNDKGASWTFTDLPFKLGGNDPGRSSGERLQVDPHNSNILFLGTNTSGLWKSTDYGASWNQVSSFPASKITFVEFDKSTGTIYAGTHDHLPSSLVAGLYQSTDGGESWALVPGQPSFISPKEEGQANTPAIANNISIAGDFLYLSYSNSTSPNGDYRIEASLTDGEVFKYNKLNGEWTKITPAKWAQGGYGGISSSPLNPDLVIVSSLERWWPQNEIHISVDGGINWKTVLNANTWSNDPLATFDFSSAPYVKDFLPHWIGTVKIDPFNADNAMFGTGYGLFATYKLTDAALGVSHWVFENKGLEETVPLALVSPPTGAPLVSAIGDFGGFIHDDLSVSPINGTFHPEGGTNTSLAFAENQPQIMVRSHNNSTTRGSYSTDGANTWTLFPTEPTGTYESGQITISADGFTILWNPAGGPLSYSTDFGSSWESSSNVPDLNPIADRVNSKTFYAYDKEAATFYRSTNGGAEFTAINQSLPALASWEDGGSVYAVPGQEGHLWVTLGSKGLFLSTNGGETFTAISEVQNAKLLSSGKAAPGQTYPALYLHGSLNDQAGLYRSDDMGTSWIRINTDEQQFGGSYRSMTGDPRVFGRIYLGTQGRGIIYGDIKAIPNNAPTAVASVSSTSGFAPLKVQFSASSSTDADGDELTYSWSFGDGNTASGAEVEHTYTTPGKFTAVLTVEDSRGGSGTDNIEINTASGLKLQYRVRSDGAKPFDNHIKPHFNIINTGSEAVPYSELTIRYWYSKEGNAPEAYWTDYAALGTQQQVKGRFVAMDTPMEGATHYLEVSFDSEKAIAAGSSSGEIQSRFNKTDWSVYDETNDYSYDSSKPNYADWERVTLYRNGELFWGIEPGNNTVTVTPPVLTKSSKSVYSSTSETFKLYPNPLQGNTLNVKTISEGGSPLTISIYNSVGTIVHHQIFSGEETSAAVKSIDVSHLTAGSYLLRAESIEGASSATFIKQ